MGKRGARGPKPHKFRNKLVLNQWLISLFGVDPFREHTVNGQKLRPFHRLVKTIKEQRGEGLTESNLHRFFHNLVDTPLFQEGELDRRTLLRYEENIVSHTQRINEHRTRSVVWKYYQWLTLLFVEIYLDRYFHNRDGLLKDLNAFVKRFNDHWSRYADVPEFTDDDLNKLCLQSATGSGKTLLMHVNLLQFQHYSKQAGREDDLSRVILLTPNERMSEQHLDELELSSLRAEWYVGGRNTLFTTAASGLNRLDVMEITKLADQDGPQQIATRSLGDQNLLLVDEGHRGMSGKEEGAWFTHRNNLCAKGFTFEYSATFEQAVAAAKSEAFEIAYAKCILFDYSYRYFYEDGFGKDYQILNLPESLGDIEQVYLTACLLKFYQQLRIYQEKHTEFLPFNLEKPLWVFVGSSVTGGKWNKEQVAVASDVARILQFVADFLHDSPTAHARINTIITGTGTDSGLLDKDNNDIFAGSFTYLAQKMNAGETAETIYRDILARLFNNAAGGSLVLSRVHGDSGEIGLKCGTAEEPFGLINVGDAKGLCDHMTQIAQEQNTPLEVTDSEFTEAMFASVKESSSPINLLIGSKKFVEGWDCWRVSTMGLMHVGKSEGSQIIQLFGRGVRLKGWEWSLKRSGHTFAPQRPNFIEELETLNVFGIEADFMEKFREFLKEEGLPGNERKQVISIPLNVTYDFGKRLKILRPKRKDSDGREYDFKRDAPVPQVGDIPEYLVKNRIISDWYPRIQAIQAVGNLVAGQTNEDVLTDRHLALLNFDALYFETERYKRERSFYNLNITKAGLRTILSNPSWYRVKIPPARLEGRDYSDVRLWQLVAEELVKRYCDKLYNYRKSEFIEPRLEYRELNRDDDNFPIEDEYQLIVDGTEEQVIQSVKQVQQELAEHQDELLRVGDLCATRFGGHLYQPLFHVRRGGKIKIMPVSLNESEYKFVKDLVEHCQANHSALEEQGVELFLLRNMSRGRGAGFFEAQNFYPDFILWLLHGGKQYVTFVEPHGLLREGIGSPKVQFHKTIKTIEERLGDPNVILNSFILSWTPHGQLLWGLSQKELEQLHVLFMIEDRDNYIRKLLDGIQQQSTTTI